MNTDKHEKSVKALFVGKCWTYLSDNFQKFSETNKIKIALELSKKDLPTVLQGEVKITQMPSITINAKELKFKVG